MALVRSGSTNCNERCLVSGGAAVVAIGRFLRFHMLGFYPVHFEFSYISSNGTLKRTEDRGGDWESHG